MFSNVINVGFLFLQLYQLLLYDRLTTNQLTWCMGNVALRAAYNYLLTYLFYLLT